MAANTVVNNDDNVFTESAQFLHQAQAKGIETANDNVSVHGAQRVSEHLSGGCSG
ncbi:MAG: hypothetical protein NVS2B16_07900 [Chloroflexota bacterium]